MKDIVRILIVFCLLFTPFSVYADDIQYADIIYDLDWPDVKAENTLFEEMGFSSQVQECYLLDLETGMRINIEIQSADHHLDVEPLTEEDTNKMCSL